jgi:hypothetical protein
MSSALRVGLSGVVVALVVAACGGSTATPKSTATSLASAATQAPASTDTSAATDTPTIEVTIAPEVTPEVTPATPTAPAGTPAPRVAWVHGQTLNAYVLAKPGIGWVYTDRGVWQSIDDGTTWANATPPRLIVSKIRGLGALDADHALMAVVDVAHSTSTYYIWRTTDGGRNWAYTALPPIAHDPTGCAPGTCQPGGDPGADFDYVDANTAFVTIWMPRGTDAIETHVFETTNGGATWTPLTYTPADEGFASCCAYRVQFKTPNIGVAEFEDQISSTTTGWGHWTHRHLATTDYSEPTMYFLSDTKWYGDLGLGYDPGSVTYNYTISTDQGQHWNNYTSAVPGIANLNGAQVTFLGPLEWIGTETTATSGGGIGPSQTIYTIDGGVHWALMGPQPIEGSTATFIDASHGWTAPNDGGPARLYSTSDSGQHWRLLTP